MAQWYITVTLLSDEAVSTLIRRLVENGYSVGAGMAGSGESSIVAGPVGDWPGRVILLKVDKQIQANNMEPIAKDFVKAAERINYLSAVIAYGGAIHVCGPHFVDETKEKPPRTAYDAMSEDRS